MLRIGLCLFLLTSCSDRLTPWAVKVPKSYQNLTLKNLERLADLPEAQLPITIALLADPQGTPGDLDRVIDAINGTENISFTMALGDLTDYGLLHEYLWAAESLEKLHRPYFTVVGNHDAISHGKTIYQKMFGEFDYSFKFAGLNFVMFNNNQFEFGQTDFDLIEQRIDSQTITASHIPPVVDAHSAEQVNLWTRNNSNAGIIGSLHGHRGGKTDFYWKVQDVPYYIAPKVLGVRYSLVTINADHTLHFQLCHKICSDEL